MSEECKFQFENFWSTKPSITPQDMSGSVLNRGSLPANRPWFFGVRFNNVLSAYELLGLLDKSCRTDVSSHFQLTSQSSKSCGNSGLLFFCQIYVLTLLEAASE